MTLTTAEVLKQLDEIYARFLAMKRSARYDDFSDQNEVDIASLMSTICEAVRRFAPADSQYVKSMDSIRSVSDSRNMATAGGVLQALKDAYERGYLANIEELVHGDVFSDFVEMAEHLCSEGYKDAAAVIAGSTLEEHLRQLCIKHGIPTHVASRPKKADTLNADLAAASAISKGDQKNVTAWLAIRNSAAHGKYGEYQKEQVALLISSIRDFLGRVPA